MPFDAKSPQPGKSAPQDDEDLSKVNRCPLKTIYTYIYGIFINMFITETCVCIVSIFIFVFKDLPLSTALDDQIKKSVFIVSALGLDIILINRSFVSF